MFKRYRIAILTKLPKEVLLDFYNEYMSTHTYVETKLYAKWVKK